MELELFETPACGRCVLLKSLLDQAGLEYRTVDVSSGLGPLRRLRRLSGRARVPVLALGERWWPAHGPDQARAAVREAGELIQANRTDRFGPDPGEKEGLL